MIDSVTLTTHSPADTVRLGERLGRNALPGDVICLTGDLGSGKTHFAKGLAEGLGIVDDVVSPTFPIVVEYDARVPFVHMDLYRLYESLPNIMDPKHNDFGYPLSDTVLETISFEEYLDGSSVVLIEWPQGVDHLLDEALFVHIESAPLPRINDRFMHVKVRGTREWTRFEEWVQSWLF